MAGQSFEQNFEQDFEHMILHVGFQAEQLILKKNVKDFIFNSIDV